MPETESDTRPLWAQAWVPFLTAAIGGIITAAALYGSTTARVDSLDELRHALTTVPERYVPRKELIARLASLEARLDRLSARLDLVVTAGYSAGAAGATPPAGHINRGEMP